MITRSMVPEYLKYILPTMLTFTMAGIYGVIDGVFVGHAVGAPGLRASTWHTRSCALSWWRERALAWAAA